MQIRATILFFDRVFGMALAQDTMQSNIPEKVAKLATKRHKVRAVRHWALSDALRKEIFALGYLIEDSEQSYEIKLM